MEVVNGDSAGGVVVVPHESVPTPRQKQCMHCDDLSDSSHVGLKPPTSTSTPPATPEISLSDKAWAVVESSASLPQAGEGGPGGGGDVTPAGSSQPTSNSPGGGAPPPPPPFIPPFIPTGVTTTPSGVIATPADEEKARVAMMMGSTSSTPSGSLMMMGGGGGSSGLDDIRGGVGGGESSGDIAPPAPPDTKLERLRDQVDALRALMEEKQEAHDIAMVESRQALEEATGLTTAESSKAVHLLAEELQNYQTEKQLVGKLIVPTSDIIELQIGGFHFAASRATLLKENDWLIAHLITRNPKHTKFFIDRDGDQFADILYWLRTGYLHIDLFGTMANSNAGGGGGAGAGYNHHSNQNYSSGGGGGHNNRNSGGGGGSSVGAEYKKIRQLRVETQFYGLRRLTRDLDSLLSARMSTHHRYAVLTYSAQFQPVSFLGEAPEGIDLFVYEADCFKSFKDMRKILTEMAQSSWHLETTIAPSPYNGRLVFYKKEDHATHPLLTDPVLTREGSKAVRNAKRV